MKLLLLLFVVGFNPPRVDETPTCDVDRRSGLYSPEEVHINNITLCKTLVWDHCDRYISLHENIYYYTDCSVWLYKIERKNIAKNGITCWTLIGTISEEYTSYPHHTEREFQWWSGKRSGRAKSIQDAMHQMAN
jgi:hypothetical protein